LIKGAFNRSAVGTLVERVSSLVFLAKMDCATATAAVQGLSAALNHVPLAMRQTFTYDLGRELMRHAEITQKTGTAIYFADPHSP
jgi:IS30 family transposase